ncbi:MAG: hypothetical protein ACXADH_13990, partial [Candidatus Kariarchaeaceae archaeon]
MVQPRITGTQLREPVAFTLRPTVAGEELALRSDLGSPIGSGFLMDVVEDLTPQLGGNLDVNG